MAPAAVTVLLGLWGIRREGSLWQDEAVTYDMAHRSLPDLWATLGHVDAVHGFYYLLMHGVFRLWEGGLVALRLPSVLAMTCATAGVAALGRRLAGARTGLAAGMVFALLPVVQRYAQEGRSYALVTALVVAQTWVLVRACTERRCNWWAGYAVLAAWSALLHEFALLALVAHGVTVLATRLPRAVVALWAAACCCAVAVTAPLVLLSLGQSRQVAWIEVPAGGDLLGFLLTTGIGLACAAVGRLAAAAPRGTGLGTVALPLLVVPPASLLLTFAFQPLYVDRYVLYAQAGLALLAGSALDTLWRYARMRAVLALATAAAVVALAPVGTHLRSPASRADDVLAVDRALREAAAPGYGVVFLPGSRRVWTLQREPASYGLADVALAAAPHASHTLYGDELPPAGIRTEMLRVSRIVVVREPARELLESNEREEVKEATLREYFTRCARRTVATALIDVYERGDSC
ncbi:glycosyltransferase family 39 protein [Streptomyces sp. ActVer]|uniref:glycosyltransferase family 39 protein n=1 Tax=Streptomyces sp. ActVer TaxID=3014558 RepID=UPI0022B43C45|nr:glycosyltransferase family 39 protein [Streptomyces sp. ActVer]MCZ4509102.1 glycosyltransferase family 39 protein [Streptomyces sp. ActVer]